MRKTNFLGMIVPLAFGLFSFKTSQGAPHNRDTCISDIRPLQYIPIDSTTGVILKRKMPDLITSIKECRPDFEVENNYVDREFEINVPSYFIWPKLDLVRVSYESGSDHFNFHIYDRIDSLQQSVRSIQIRYDFTGERKEAILKSLAAGDRQFTEKKVKDQTIYLFRNYQKMFCGQICLDNNIIVGYCTSDETSITQLEAAILTFKLK